MDFSVISRALTSILSWARKKTKTFRPYGVDDTHSGHLHRTMNSALEQSSTSRPAVQSSSGQTERGAKSQMRPQTGPKLGSFSPSQSPPTENVPPANIMNNHRAASPSTLQGYELRKEESKKTYQDYENQGQHQLQHQQHHHESMHTRQAESPNPSVGHGAASSATPISTLSSAATLTEESVDAGVRGMESDLYSLLDIASSPQSDGGSASTSPAAAGTFTASANASAELKDAFGGCLGDDVEKEAADYSADNNSSFVGSHTSNIAAASAALPLLPAEDKLATAKYQLSATKARHAQKPAAAATAATAIVASPECYSSYSRVGIDNPAVELAEALASNEKSFNRAINNIRISGAGGAGGAGDSFRLVQSHAPTPDMPDTHDRNGNDHNMHCQAAYMAPAEAASPRSVTSNDYQYADKSFIAIGDIVAASPDVMLETQRQMQATMVEMQLELDSARMDRDSLLTVASAAQIDRQVAATAAAAVAVAATESTNSDAKELEEAQRELHALRSILERKESSLQALSIILHEEREDRTRYEEATSRQVQDYLQRFTSLQTHLEMQEERLRDQQRQHEQILQRQESKYEEQKEKASAAENSELSVRQLAGTVAHASQEHALQLEKQLAIERERAQVTGEESLSFQAQLESQQQQYKAVVMDLSKCRSHLEESRTQVISLQTLLQREGFTLQQHAVETQQLAAVVAAAREDVQRLPAVEKALREEQTARISEAQKAQALEKRQTRALSDTASRAQYWEELSTKQKVYISQLEKAHADEADGAVVATKALQEVRQQVHYWQQLAQSEEKGVQQTTAAVASPTMEPGPSPSLSSQSSLPSYSEQDIQAIQAKAVEQRQQMEAAQLAMQEEYASLWVVVQDLNKIDQTKEQAIDLLLREKQDDRAKLHKMYNRYQSVQSELKEIDRELLEEARAAGVQFTGSKLLDRSELPRAVVQMNVKVQKQGPENTISIGTEKNALSSPENNRVRGLSAHSTPVPTAPLLTSAAALTASLEKQKARVQQGGHTNSGSNATPSRRAKSRSNTPSSLSHSSSSADIALVVEAAREAQEYDLCRSLDEINSVLEKKVKEKSPHKIHTTDESEKLPVI